MQLSAHSEDFFAKELLAGPQPGPPLLQFARRTLHRDPFQSLALAIAKGRVTVQLTSS